MASEPTADGVTPAHDQILVARVRVHYPAHAPRASDPHYAAFTAFERRSKRLGLAVCAIKSNLHGGAVQCHHSKIEFSLQGNVDLAKFDEAYGLHLASDDDFRAFVEGEGNAEWLCTYHHIGAEGVHVVSEPLWLDIRVARDDVGPVAVAIGVDGKPLHGEAMPT